MITRLDVFGWWIVLRIERLSLPQLDAFRSRYADGWYAFAIDIGRLRWSITLQSPASRVRWPGVYDAMPAPLTTQR